ncbi:hypothetical protein AKJ09_00108 [Labilithrix luteola]|uniref:Uncharacterized protein n=1 Tax=Labilithrix luteola TaxID=1391654 RepID=A0A0K1PK02_9BACT|nr:hypothetical protein [Labilithrix luteola]AKU93444.1 hypothetical protein AKJ09_00108 [Labilithrix luteola]
MWLRQSPRNAHTELCDDGAKLLDDDVRRLEQAVAARPDDLEGRLRLHGRARHARHEDRRDLDQTLWFVEHHPALDLGLYWAMPEEHTERGLGAWQFALAQPEHPLIVHANAAWSMAEHDFDFAEETHHQADEIAAGDVTWWYRKASLFVGLTNRWAPGDRQKRAAKIAAHALANVLLLEEDLETRIRLHWEAKLTAALLRGSELHRLLRLADQHIGRIDVVTNVPNGSPPIARGLAALAIGRRDLAEQALLEALDAPDCREQSVHALASELGKSRAILKASDYLLALAHRHTSHASALRRWSETLARLETR